MLQENILKESPYLIVTGYRMLAGEFFDLWCSMNTLETEGSNHYWENNNKTTNIAKTQFKK